jgi:hypothetical protein
MSFIYKLIKKKPTKYVLRARKDGVWEDIAEYDRYVGMAEISDVLDNLKEDGYDFVRLELVDEEGKRVKIAWSKKWKPRGKMIEKAVSEIKEYVEFIKAFKEALKTEENDPFAVMASAVSFLETFRKVCDNYPVLCGKEKMGEDRLIENLLMRIIEARLGMPISSNPTSNPAPAPTFNPTPASIPNIPVSPEVAEKFNQIVEESMKKASELITSECQVLQKCEEGLSGKLEEELGGEEVEESE